jgi:PPOX class probable F420-dependent enzyme
MAESLDLGKVRELIPAERGLAVASTTRADGSVHSAVINAGVTTHPLTGDEVAAYVALGGVMKLRHLRARPRLTLTWRVGWRWQTVEGTVTLIGPDDPLEGFDPAGLPQLLRDVFLSTGSTHDDWPTYDRVMAEERRCAVLVRPDRVYGRG